MEETTGWQLMWRNGGERVESGRHSGYEVVKRGGMEKWGGYRGSREGG